MININFIATIQHPASFGPHTTITLSPLIERVIRDDHRLSWRLIGTTRLDDHLIFTGILDQLALIVDLGIDLSDELGHLRYDLLVKGAARVHRLLALLEQRGHWPVGRPGLRSELKDRVQVSTLWVNDIEKGFVDDTSQEGRVKVIGEFRRGS